MRNIFSFIWLEKHTAFQVIMRCGDQK